MNQSRIHKKELDLIKSMTGFGKGEAGGKLGNFTAEIRTVNHRYLDISLRVPDNFGILEERIKNYISRYIKRGKINLSISYKKDYNEVASIKIDSEAIDRYYNILKSLKRRYGLKEEIKLSHLLIFPDIFTLEQPEFDVESVWPVLENAIKKAVFNCNRMREKEGRVLYLDLSGRVSKISNCIDKINSLVPKQLEDYKKMLKSRLREMFKDTDIRVDPYRLELEVTMLARQSDISEEITRSRSHIDALKKSLSSNGETGRRIDFILQELQREINTLGSKASDVRISRLVVDIKSEIEKMREQVQNVE